MDADQFALDRFHRLGSGVHRGLHGGDIADHDGCDQSVADLCHRSGEFNIRGFEHCIGALDKGDQAAGFKESYGLWHVEFFRDLRFEI